VAGRRGGPRFLFVVLWRQAYAKDATASFGFLNDPFDQRSTDLTHAREKGPLVGPGDEVAIEKDAVVLSISARCCFSTTLLRGSYGRPQST
jgi:hypothetical protein